MNHAKILDCTLRDGAYLLDKKFGDNVINGIVKGLVEAGVDLIEIGFLQDDGFGEGKTVFLNSVEAKKFIPKEKRGSLFTALADYSRYSISNLDQYDGTSLDAVRACFFKEERYEVLDFCRAVKEKGYMLFVQPVDILGYTDAEIIEFIDLINEIEPYCLSIVDTFGSMYTDDLHRIFSLINHNLISIAKIGFHSHNNLQMSNALSQEFLHMSYGKRDVIVDTTISGLGRGAGNTPTELVAQYMVSKLGYSYDIDSILDMIDTYIENIKLKCTWGYSTPYFIAGCYNAHVNNVTYLTEKNSIRSKDIRYILNKIGMQERKRYEYDLLESEYMEYLNSDIDDSNDIERLKQTLSGRNILILAPGNSVLAQRKEIQEYIRLKNPVVIAVNFIPAEICCDYLYISNTKRFKQWSVAKEFVNVKKIITSNIVRIMENRNQDDIVVNFVKLVKCGWEHMDNSVLMLLRLLDLLEVDSIGLAGFDGYSSKKAENYAVPEMELSRVSENSLAMNEEIQLMMNDFMENKKSKCEITFVTESRFDKK